MMKRDKIDTVAKLAGDARGWYFTGSKLRALDDSVELTWYKDRGDRYYYCFILDARELWDMNTAINSIVAYLERADEDCYRQYREKQKAPNTSEVLEALPPEWGEVCL